MVALPLLNTKLYIPPLHPEIIERTHLVGRLERGLSGKLTLVSAPAGFGKTTLIQEWISGRNDSASWLSLDLEDNDPIRFWFYMIAALQQIQGGLGESIAAALSEPHPPPLEHLLTDLINEISPPQVNGTSQGNLQGKSILVLDDYHLITDRRIHESVTFFLDHLPPTLHLVIATRADPPWPLARMRARLRVTEIRAEELRFNLQEADAFLNERMGLALSPKNIALLEERTEGWIVGLQMAALSMRSREDKNNFIQAFTGTHRYILDYLVEEVLEQQSLDTRSFLLRTSILNRMSATLCDYVLGINNSDEILSQLESANLFVVPLDEVRSWYRYHHLFSELLKSLLNTKHPELVSHLNKQASKWLEDHQFTEDAIQHAFAAKDDERVAKLIEDYGMEMLQVSKYIQLSGWLESLPPIVILKRPWLCVYQAWTRHWAGLREGGEDCLENAEKVISVSTSISEHEEKRLSGYIAAVRAHYALTNEALAQCIQQARKALRHLPKDDHFVRCTAGVALGGAYWGKGTIREAEKAFSNSVSEALKGGYYLRASSALCYVGMQQVKQARLFLAEKTFHKSLALVQDSKGRFFPNAGFPLAKLGELACEWNNLDQANAYSKQGVNLCQQLGHIDLLTEANASLARVQLAREEFSDVEETLANTDQLTSGIKIDPWASTWLDSCRIRLWSSTNRLDHIHHWINTCGLDIDGPVNFQHDLSHINYARAMIALSENNPNHKYAKDALTLLLRLSDTAEKFGWLHHRIQILVLAAKAYHFLDEQDNAITTLTEALTLSEPSRYVRIYIGEGPRIGNLLNAILDSHNGGPVSQLSKSKEKYVKALLSTPGMDLYGSKPADGERLIEPLTDRELDVLRFLVTNKTVPEIADELVISPNTVRSHVKHIYEKLGVHRRLSAVKIAKDLNLV